MMRALILLHRWLGVAFCLLFAMWFATGIVMHFVPFPSLTEAERIAGLVELDLRDIATTPAAAVSASKLGDAARVRLIARPDGAVFVLAGASGLVALHAADLTPATVTSEPLALAIARDHARRRNMDDSKAAVVELADYDQWTVPNRFDPHRPLYRIALNDEAGSELDVSSVTGEVLLDTTRRERWWNYAGSVTHWIYPTILRSNWAAWDRTVWWLSLLAVIAAVSGALLGTIRIRKAWRRILMSLRGWHAWHHVLGLVTMSFVLTWIVSGWLSMDHGRLFSRGVLTETQAAKSASRPAWNDIAPDWPRSVSAGTKEIEWFALGASVYQRDRTALASQVLHTIGDVTSVPFLRAQDIDRWIRQFASGCQASVVIAAGDDYAAASVVPTAPVYRAICGDVWFHVDSATGVMLERLDPSRRAYRWAYGALHTLDFPVLIAHPLLRSGLVVGLCSLGLLFSLTGVVLGWRRLWLR